MQEKEADKNETGRILERYIRKEKFTTPFQAEEFSIYIKKDSRILDVGCPFVRTLNELYHNSFHNLIRIDFSSGMIER